MKAGWLFILPWSHSAIGGVSRVVNELAGQFASSGDYHPVLLELSWSHREPEVTRHQHFTLIRMRLPAPPADGRALKQWAMWLFSLPAVLMRFRSLIRQYRVAVLNPHYPDLWLTSLAILARLQGLPLLVSLHGRDVLDHGQRNGFARRVMDWALQQSTAIVACSSGLAKRFSEVSSGDFDRILKHIHNGINPEAFAGQVQASRGAAPNLLCVATFEEKKGQDLLIGAVASLSTDYPDISLTLVGRQTAYLESLKQLVHTKGLDGQVRFAIDVPPEQVVDYYRQADVFVSSSRFEPFGLVILEAGMMRLPVVATRTDGATEIIEHEQHGLLVPSEDIGAMTEAIQRLLENQSLAKSCVEALETRIREQFTWARAAHEYQRLATDVHTEQG